MKETRKNESIYQEEWALIETTYRLDRTVLESDLFDESQKNYELPDDVLEQFKEWF